MSQTQHAVSYSAGSSSMTFPERSPSPFAGSSYCASSSSMISPQRSPSHLHTQLKIFSTRNLNSASSQRVKGKVSPVREQCYRVDMNVDNSYIFPDFIHDRQCEEWLMFVLHLTSTTVQVYNFLNF